MIRVANLTRRHPDGEGISRPVLEGVGFEVKAGEHVAVMGASGSGKSTLLQLLGGLDGAFEGEITIDGLSLRTLDDAARSRFRSRQVGFVFQSYPLVQQLSAWRNAALPAVFAGEPVLDAEPRARALLTRLGLAKKLEHTPHQLSGGERQRVAIARALFMKPKLLLADEPTGNLDAASSAEVVALFRSLAKDEGLTLVVATHEPKVAEAADRVLRLEHGRLVAPAPPPAAEARP